MCGDPPFRVGLPLFCVRRGFSRVKPVCLPLPPHIPPRSKGAERVSQAQSLARSSGQRRLSPSPPAAHRDRAWPGPQRPRHCRNAGCQRADSGELPARSWPPREPQEAGTPRFVTAFTLPSLPSGCVRARDSPGSPASNPQPPPCLPSWGALRLHPLTRPARTSSGAP